MRESPKELLWTKLPENGKTILWRRHEDVLVKFDLLMDPLSCSYMGNEGFVPAANLRKIGSARHSVVTQPMERKIAVASSSPATFRKESGECCGPCCLGNAVGAFQNATRRHRRGSAWPGHECQYGVAA